MKFNNFESIISHERLQRYVNACSGDTMKAMTLYRLNLRLSQEIFTIISCFEVALRNAIDRELKSSLGVDWLRDAATPGGIFDVPQLRDTYRIINKNYNRMNSAGLYTPSQLLSSMEFGIWKYMFSNPQYRATGRTLLRIFPNRPSSTPAMQYNNAYLFNELDKVNSLRNRIAHHEQICFTHRSAGIDTSYVLNEYNKIQVLFLWMGIDSRDLLYGLDHVQQVCQRINSL